MHLNKMGFRWVLWVLIVLPNMWLFACDDKAHNTSLDNELLATIANPHDAQVWLEQQAQRAQYDDTTRNNPEKLTDRRLLRITDLTSNKVFISMNSEAINVFTSQSTEDVENDQGKVKLSDGERLTLNGRDMSAAQIEQPVRTTLELAQADLSQIRFSGVMQKEHEWFGLIQVGERVYRVKPNESIGVGKWRIVSVDDLGMRLMVNGKVVAYDK